jgi:hypothetical protein
MIRFKLWMGILLLFSLGALTGSFITGIYYKEKMVRIEKYGTPGRVPLVMEELARELHLSKAQRKDIRKIIMGFNETLFDIQRHFRQEMNALRENLRISTKEKLDDTQKQKYDALFERLTLKTPMLPGIIKTGLETEKDIIYEMKNRLNLTKEQESGIRSVIEKGLEQKEKIRQKLREDHFKDRQRQLENRRNISKIIRLQKMKCKN